MSRLYEVTVTTMREGFKKAQVYVYHVAASTRGRAITIARKGTYTEYADAVSVSARSLGESQRTEYRVLTENKS